MVAVVHIELVGIQQFVFRSRTLKDTVGRSSRLNEFTSGGAAAFVKQWDGGVVEVVFAAAGRISVLVADELAERFVGWFTRSVANASDALRPVVDIRTCADEAEVTVALLETGVRLQQARHVTAPSLAGAAPWGALSCRVSGGPAEDMDADGQPCGGDIVRADEWARRWHRSQQSELLAGVGEFWRENLVLPEKIDTLGRSLGESSQVAVLVADLNGIGAKMRALAAGGDPLTRLGRASEALTAAGKQLGRHLVEIVVGALVFEPGTGAPTVTGFPDTLSFALHGETDSGPWFLPLRPWVLAGDDLVLVCESRIAWSLAMAITGWLDEPNLPDDDPRAVLEELFGERPTVGIGIAVVPVGYPLIRAHEAAAALCSNVKQHIREQTGGGGGLHGIDWHRGGADPAAVLTTRRSEMTGRPYLFEPGERGGSQDLRTFTRTWLGGGEQSLRGRVFDRHRGWSRGRLREAALDLRSPHGDSTAVVQQAVAALNRSRQLAGLPEAGLAANERHAILDAIDLMDEHLALHIAASATSPRTQDDLH